MRKNFFHLFCILIGSIFVMMGCSNGYDRNTTLEKRKTQEKMGKTSQEANIDSKDAKPEPQESDNFNMDNIKALEVAIDNLIENNWLIGGYQFSDNILFMILKETNDSVIRFVFFDVNDGQVLKEWKEDGVSLPLECLIYDGEVIVYDSSPAAYIISENSEQIERIEIDEEFCLSSMRIRNFCILPKQRKIIYYKNDIEEYLYSCDFNGEHKKQIIKLKSPETKLNYLNGFLKIDVAVDESLLYFTGYYAVDLKQQLKNCYGSLDFISGDLEINYEERGFYKVFEKGALFYDGLQEAKGITGKIEILYNNKDKKEFSFPEKEESQTVFIDSDGGVFYSCLNDDLSGTTQIKKYSVKSGKLLRSFDLPIYTHDLILFEKKEIGFVYYNDIKKNKWSLYAFSTK